jgi:drug/metabolite transporter (DMT)-like permease
MRNFNVPGIAAAIVTITVWTSFIVFARASAQLSLTPLDIVFARMLGAVIILAPWGAWLVWRAQQNKQPASFTQINGAMAKFNHGHSLWGLSPLPLRTTVVLGLLGGLAYAPLAYTAFFFAPAAHGAVLMPGTLPLSTALVAAVVLGERFSRQRVVGLILIACGGLLVGGASLLKAFEGGDVWIGDLLFIGASSTWAMYSVLARKYQVDAVKATIAITVFASLIYLPIYGGLAFFQALPAPIQSQLGTAPLKEILLQMVIQGMGSVVISGISFTMMLKHFGPVRSTMLTALVPSLASLSAVFILDEPLYWNLIAGLILALVGVVLGVMSANKK